MDGINPLWVGLAFFLTPLDLPSELDALILFAAKIDKCLLERDRTRNRPPGPEPGSGAPRGFLPEHSHSPTSTPTFHVQNESEEPMQIGCTRLHRCNEGRCIYCAQLDHLLENCPLRRSGAARQAPVLVGTTSSKFRAHRQFTEVTLSSEFLSLKHIALIDSGADASLMDVNLAKRFPPVPLDSPVPATALDGHMMYLVTHCTSPLTLTFPDSHTERLTFHLFEAPQHPLVLGFPWLLLHNPHIHWTSGRVSAWGEDCAKHCFPGPTSSIGEVVSTLPEEIDEEEFPDLSTVPPCYRDKTL